MALRDLVPDIVGEYESEAGSIVRQINALKARGGVVDCDAVSNVVVSVFKYWFEVDIGRDEAGEVARRVLDRLGLEPTATVWFQIV